MKKYFLVFLIPAAALLIAGMLRPADITSFIVRTAAGLDLSDRGILLNYSYIAPGLRQKPFVLPFSRSLEKFTAGALNLDVVNTYTVGGYAKDDSARLGGLCNFLDPTSKFKDSWFGVYIIQDDPDGRARRFMLRDPLSPVDDLYNLNTASLLELVRLDQMVVVHTTRQGLAGHNLQSHTNTFHFKKIDASEYHEVVFDRHKNPWLKITASFTTLAAVTDRSATAMRPLASIRAFVGLPDERVYRLVDPWHPVVLRGATLARHVRCPKGGFWAVVYYNGSAFTTRDGRAVDTWEHSDIVQEFETMFLSLDIGCGG